MRLTTLLVIGVTCASTAVGDTSRKPREIGDWRLHYTKDPLDDRTQVFLTAVTSEEPVLEFTCWKGSETDTLLATIATVDLSGLPLGGSIRLTTKPGRKTSWLYVNDSLLQTVVSKDELEGLIKAKGRIVLQVFTDRDDAIKKVYEAPAKVSPAVRTFLRECHLRTVPKSRDFVEQLELLDEFLGEAVAILASSPSPIQGRLQVVWDDYVKHLTPDHIPLEALRPDLESLQSELAGREPQELTDEESADVAYRIVRLHAEVVGQMRGW